MVKDSIHPWLLPPRLHLRVVVEMVLLTADCANGEGYDSTSATADMPTLTRHNGESAVYSL